MSSQRKRILVIGAELAEVVATLIGTLGADAEVVEEYAHPSPKTKTAVFSALSHGSYVAVIVAYWPSLELLIEIRERFPALKTIFLNSYSELDATARAKGVDVVLPVPFQVSDLSAAIQKFLSP